MPKAERKAANDIDNDPMFDISPKAKQKALDRRLIQLIERAERLEEEKKGLSDDLRDVFAEAKAVGYDSKLVKAMMKLRKMKPDDRAEMDALMETYRAAVGLD
jgi:uncharacterized protein (UPF0335 family)